MVDSSSGVPLVERFHCSTMFQQLNLPQGPMCGVVWCVCFEMDGLMFFSLQSLQQLNPKKFVALVGALMQAIQ